MRNCVLIQYLSGVITLSSINPKDLWEPEPLISTMEHIWTNKNWDTVKEEGGGLPCQKVTKSDFGEGLGLFSQPKLTIY